MPATTPPATDSPILFPEVSWCHDNVLDWNGCLPREAVHSKIQFNSIFFCTGWTQWSLTVGELTAAFDVPRPMATRLPTLAQDVCHSFGHLSATPTKLLAKILPHFLKAHELSPHLAHPSAKGLAEETNQVPEEPVRTTASSFVYREDSEDVSGPTPTPAKNYAVAVKADKADVPIELWNDRIWAAVTAHSTV
jgi:hypothetical protein